MALTVSKAYEYIVGGQLCESRLVGVEHDHSPPVKSGK